MQRLRHALLCLLFCASAALSSASSARAFEAAVGLVALTVQFIGAVVQLSEAIAVLASPTSKQSTSSPCTPPPRRDDPESGIYSVI